MLIVYSVLALAGMALNFAYWWFVVRHWSDRFRRYCERRYGVSITIGHKGHWRVSVSGGGPWYRRFAIEWLQLAYFMAAMIAWMVVIVGGIIVIAVVERR